MTIPQKNGLAAGRWISIFDSGISVLLPRANVKESTDAFFVEAEMPGVKKEDIELVCENGMLTIGAKVQDDNKEGVRILRQERFEGDIRRRFVLKDIKEENITAQYENGILTVTLPKKASEERQISIE